MGQAQGAAPYIRPPGWGSGTGQRGRAGTRHRPYVDPVIVASPRGGGRHKAQPYIDPRSHRETITMPYDAHRHHRRSIRLKGYDYSQAGAYYFTIIAQHRACLFGDIVRAEMILNDAGEMFWKEWNALPERFPNVELDEFVVMPNHIHGIFLITEEPNMGLASPKGGLSGTAPSENNSHRPTLGNILGAWKSIVTGEYIKGVHQYHWKPFERKLLQRDYWEHIIRNERELDSIREYIFNNPANWENDDHNPKNVRQL